jgi:hypothetical protein
MNFILPLVLTFECEPKYTEYFKETDKTFVIYRITQNQIAINQNIFEFKLSVFGHYSFSFDLNDTE